MKRLTAPKHKRRLVLVSLVALAALAIPATTMASPTVRLSIWHVVAHCHVWGTNTKKFGASHKLIVKRGTTLAIRSMCPMDFDFRQTQGPKLSLGDKRTYAGVTRKLTFKKAGTYRLVAKNVQSPEERGLDTVGETNVLTLTVVVK